MCNISHVFLDNMDNFLGNNSSYIGGEHDENIGS